MISMEMFKEACKEAGAHQVSHAALKKFDAWMFRFMVDVAQKSVRNMAADKRVRVEPSDIGE